MWNFDFKYARYSSHQASRGGNDGQFQIHWTQSHLLKTKKQTCWWFVQSQDKHTQKQTHSIKFQCTNWRQKQKINKVKACDFVTAVNSIIERVSNCHAAGDPRPKGSDWRCFGAGSQRHICLQKWSTEYSVVLAHWDNNMLRLLHNKSFKTIRCKLMSAGVFSDPIW